ncbi:hypothetical protein M404DRAFT_758149 [Pisolithus tinctorius Marx 270]|uniref:Uncharacterized protein n=1 Tax=Pisolithus tinctorius Marx 270 TaxID=870435 RepID=A0A0C3NI38_PISTI|nr:hypothetical protein M404DRAFT_758149 [Pisolithus tinctorius Marx 270]
MRATSVYLTTNLALRCPCNSRIQLLVGWYQFSETMLHRQNPTAPPVTSNVLFNTHRKEKKKHHYFRGTISGVCRVFRSGQCVLPRIMVHMKELRSVIRIKLSPSENLVVTREL